MHTLLTGENTPINHKSVEVCIQKNVQCPWCGVWRVAHQIPYIEESTFGVDTCVHTGTACAVLYQTLSFVITLTKRYASYTCTPAKGTRTHALRMQTKTYHILLLHLIPSGLGFHSSGNRPSVKSRTRTIT